jgi:hypothetical protein
MTSAGRIGNPRLPVGSEIMISKPIDAITNADISPAVYHLSCGGLTRG